jgi:hypothetical protein
MSVKEMGDMHGGGRRLVLLIDALDESEKSGNNDLLKFLSDKVKHLPDGLVVAVTSRPETVIKTALRRYAPVDIDCDSTNNLSDIKMYVEHRLTELMRDADDATRADATQVLCEKAGGVFVYVAKVTGARRRRRTDVGQSKGVPVRLDGLDHTNDG